jgi:hypothetical protein
MSLDHLYNKIIMASNILVERFNACSIVVLLSLVNFKVKTTQICHSYPMKENFDHMRLLKVMESTKTKPLFIQTKKNHLLPNF